MTDEQRERIREVKEKLRFESADSELNQSMMEGLSHDPDCFGVGFDEDDEECRACTVLTSVDDRKDMLGVFCAELCGETFNQEDTKGVNEMAEEVKEPKVEKPKKEKKQTDIGMIREMFAAGKTEEEICAVMVPIYTSRGITEQSARRGIRYRFKKLQGLVK